MKVNTFEIENCSRVIGLLTGIEGYLQMIRKSDDAYSL